MATGPRVLINVDVEDLDVGVRFFCDVLGLRVGRRFDGAFIELLGGGAPIYLLAKPAGSRPFAGAPPRDYARHWTPVHLDFAVDDLDATLARALAFGCKSESAVKEEPYGRLALLSDPFGHGLCLIEFNAKGYDALTEG